ncbi:MAG: class I SAM-dependent methyltransferase [Cyclobacteriaceae bacterium]|nr:class I SAM-dependent methyltransferase [Cyclobacteriaceae bacterium]
MKTSHSDREIMDFRELNKVLGNTDLLLMDQILRGKFLPGMRMLDAGCGEGRNMVYFIKNGFSIYGIDMDPGAVSLARLTAGTISKKYVAENIFQSSIEENSFPDEFFDMTICINVLHLARDMDHFFNMLAALARILKKSGLLFMVMEQELLPGTDKKTTVIEGKRGPEAGKRFYLTKELLTRIKSWKKLEKTGESRTYQIEDKVSLSGCWFRKIQ